jgi:hypothetical protein
MSNIEECHYLFSFKRKIFIDRSSVRNNGKHSVYILSAWYIYLQLHVYMEHKLVFFNVKRLGSSKP